MNQRSAVQEFLVAQSAALVDVFGEESERRLAPGLKIRIAPNDQRLPPQPGVYTSLRRLFALFGVNKCTEAKLCIKSNRPWN
jgi:hypothetical protein